MNPSSIHPLRGYIKIIVGLISLSAVIIGLQGCVSGIRATNSGVTTLANFESGNLVPMTTFSTTDVVRFYVSVTWDDVTKEAGFHDVIWNWYQNGKVVGHLEDQNGYFKGAPNMRFATQPASGLGTGHFSVECLIDGKRTAAAEFDIK
jgi:hypothetical protein